MESWGLGHSMIRISMRLMCWILRGELNVTAVLGLIGVVLTGWAGIVLRLWIILRVMTDYIFGWAVNMKCLGLMVDDSGRKMEILVPISFIRFFADLLVVP